MIFYVVPNGRTKIRGRNEKRQKRERSREGDGRMEQEERIKRNFRIQSIYRVPLCGTTLGMLFNQFIGYSGEVIRPGMTQLQLMRHDLR